MLARDTMDLPDSKLPFYSVLSHVTQYIQHSEIASYNFTRVFRGTPLLLLLQSSLPNC